MEIYKTISGAALAAFAPLLCAICVSCVDENALQTGQNETAFEAVGELVDVSLNITVEELAVSSTKAEVPTADADKTANDEEKHIDDLWVLEYDATDGNLICRPQRVEITKQEELQDVKVTLADNNGDEVVIYVVANCGSGVSSNSESWVVETTLGDGSISYPGFMTIKDLEANTIPTPHPQRMTWDAATEAYVLDSQDATNVSIPMAGSVGSAEEKVTVSAESVIEVHVTRMFAKLLVRVDLSDYDGTDLTPTLNSVIIGSIPEYCTVGTLWDSETGDNARAATYAEGVQWLQRTFNPVEESAGGGSATDPSAGEDDTLYPYLIYIPENIQGESGSSTDKTKNVPNDYALTAVASVYMTDSRGTTIGPYSYTAYPGGNSTTNFNVRRNCVYRVTLRVGYLTTLDVLPSANCIVCLSGETTAFFPYCREEKGGGYDFEDYLYSGDDGAKPGQKIDHVGIIWQSTDGGNTVDYSDTATGYIGDNTEGDLVWIDNVSDVAGEYYRRIYVKIPDGATGNALIGAYNSAGEIIWSWHIWSRLAENDPRTVNTKLYYTYDWDNTGIYDLYSDRPRVAGYTIMNCNLGAMQDDPSGSVSASGSSGGATTAFGNARPTFGTLYQWGRKDPFPPIRKHIATTGYGGTLGANNVIDEYNVDAVGNYFDNGNNVVGITSAGLSAGELFYSVPGTEREEFETMIPLTIQNPTVFYAGMIDVNQLDMTKLGGNSGGTSSTALNTYFPEPHDANWLLDSDSDHYNRLWGGLDPEKDDILKTYNTGLTDRIGHEVHLYDDYGEKSIFDPCPYGWRVSPPDLWLGFTDTGVNPNGSLNYVNYDTTSSNSSYVGMAMYMTEWRTGPTSFFPIQGVRSPDGCAYRSGQCGNYVNATADSNDRVNNLHIHYAKEYFNIFETSQLPYFIKSTAAAVRCVNTASVQQ